MKKVFKWIGIVVGSLILLLLIIAAAIFMNGKSKAAATYAVAHDFDAGPADSLVLARGKYLVEVVSRCTGCHGEGLRGNILVDDAAFGFIPAPNLTAGDGGVGAVYVDSDWERAIRHGVGGDGRLLVGMPAEYLTHYGDADLRAVIAFVKSVPPHDNILPAKNLGPMANMLIGAGMYKPPAIALDHNLDHADAPESAVTAAYGEYLVSIGTCSECHGAALKGPEFEGPPPGPDLTSTGNLGSWTEDQFILTLRSGTTPDGRILDAELMPWQYTTRMSDLELRAIWTYLKTL